MDINSSVEDYFKIPKNFGKPPRYTPEEFLDKANEYFAWCIKNPLQEEQIVKYKDHYEKVNVSKPRVYTIEGLTTFAELGMRTFYDYEVKAHYSQVITYIRKTIYKQKFEGASAGFFKENLIIRDLGIKDAQEVTHSNQLKAFNQDEVKMLNTSFKTDYGKIPESDIIDIDFEEINDDA